LGERTIALLFETGLLREFSDLYSLTYDDICSLEGFCDLSTKNLLNGIEQSKKAHFEHVIFGLSIGLVSRMVAKKLDVHFQDIDRFANATYDELVTVPEIGERIAQSVVSFFDDEENKVLIEKLKQAGLNFKSEKTIFVPESNALENKTFVISGVFEKFERDELKNLIQKNGGKVLSAISGKLDYLLAGDKMGPSKLEKAKSLNIPIISESEFLNMIDKKP